MCVGPWGPLELNSDGAPFKVWPQRRGLHKDKEDKQSRKYTTLPVSFMRDTENILVKAKELL